MPVLALDTSAAVAVSLLADGGGTLASRVVHEERRHAEQLAPVIAELLAETGTDRTALTAVVVGTGPAPFTGLRVGLVTARTLGLALGIPVHGVSGLDALAAQAAADLALAAGTEVLVATDARRREVYWARYRVVAGDSGAAGSRTAHPRTAQSGSSEPGTAQSGMSEPGTAALDVELVAGPGVASAAQVAADGHLAGAVVVGRGAGLYPETLPPAVGGPLDPDPAVLARLALLRSARGDALPTEPLYLRRPDVMPPAERKRALR